MAPFSEIVVQIRFVIQAIRVGYSSSRRVLYISSAGLALVLGLNKGEIVSIGAWLTIEIATVKI